MNPLPLPIDGEGFRLRPWRHDDADSLVLHANDEQVSRCLSDRFPFPYTIGDARDFLGRPVPPPAFSLAIEIEGAAAGGIGLRPGEAEQRIGAQFGYWLGRRYWGRGIMSRIVPVWCDQVFAHFGFERLQATVLSNNPASARVLEKCGFTYEGTLRRAAIKAGEIFDFRMYAMIRPDPASTSQDPFA